ncbi:TRAP transporter substrate-binding protein [Petroclostridium sp. X23]|uniref:TRAP transporter substrate-binding protein n=1 Tax=Petroclostridium sp. X23 TaxID=3045146 RepID=UPI0024ACB239|nr:TRAP transporter substrate-binding protein [Petroclostridium sp. X23]WHH59080.1 TRAP transporter substrate-binding protein [Petroclostridium sp. X23]
MEKFISRNQILVVLGVVFVLTLLIYVYNVFYDAKKDSTQYKGSKISRQSAVFDDPIPEEMIILKIAHNYPESHPQHLALVEKFIPMVQEQSSWKIRVETYPNNQLIGEKGYIQGVKHGTIEMCIGSQSVEDILPKMSIIKYPYIFDSYEQAMNVLNGEFGNKIIEGMDALGVRCLAWTLNGFRQISISQKDIPNKGYLRKPLLATAFSGINLDTLKAMQFDALSLDVQDTAMALRQNVVDGHDSPPLLSYNNGWYNNQKKIIVTNHIISPTMYLISDKFWRSLSKEHRELIEKAAKESAAYEVKLLRKAEEDIFKALEQKGIEIEYPDITVYKRTVSPLYNEWLNNNDELKKLLNQLINENNI